MAYSDYSDKYLPGEYLRGVFGSGRFRFAPNTETTMDSESFQRFLNLQRDPEALFTQTAKYPKGFTDYMSFMTEFGLTPRA
jgi:hypothetical protein